MSNPPLPAVPASPPNTTSVRRHHTISASSRAVRTNAREAITEEMQRQDLYNDDEVVDDDWVGPVGAVGEKSSLHRQASLPTKYHRAFHPAPKAGGNLTPKTMNSLTAIAGHEGDEDEWESEIGGYSAHEEEYSQAMDNNSPLSPYSVAVPPVPSPPSPASGVRRHVSLTYGAPGGVGRTKVTVKRSGTLQATVSKHSAAQPEQSVEVEAENEYFEYPADESAPYEDEEYLKSQGNDWRTPGSSGFGGNNSGSNNVAIDDVQRALSALELANNVPQTQMYPGSYGQSIHPPRFNPPHPHAVRNNSGNGNNNGNGTNGNGQKLQLTTDFDGRKTPLSQGGTAPVYQQQYPAQQAASWDQKDRVLVNRTSNPNLQYGYNQQGGHSKSASGSSPGSVPSVPAIPQQYLQQTRGGASNFSQTGQQQGQSSGQTSGQQFTAATPIDVPSLIASKGYNPQTFDTRPSFARYFVIKSYTEDDVHKSLKYEIWSSTEPGNKRLDKAFKECAGRGPIYLFFSVNGSGHFCGMAEMLTPIDYTRSSNVWAASDKWKGVFKVKWIFVRDIPNITLRHIKLLNTQERKPVTNSRDTQELLPDAGIEMLRIFFTHPARTSLLQDFAFYELQSIQKNQTQSGTSSPTLSPPNGGLSPSLQSVSPVPQQQSPNPQQQALYNNPNALAYQMPQMTPMMQMQMGMGMGMIPNQFNLAAQTQAMHQSVMRHPSPGPTNPSQPGFMGF